MRISLGEVYIGLERLALPSTVRTLVWLSFLVGKLNKIQIILKILGFTLGGRSGFYKFDILSKA